MAKGEINWLLVVGIIALGYFFIVGNPFAAKETTTQEPSGSTITGGNGCSIEDIALTPKMTRLGVAGTSLSTAAYNYFVLSDKLGSYAGSATATVPTNYDMKIIFAENATDYYSVVKEFNTDCQDPKYVTVELPMADTSLNTFYLKNADGTVNSAANAQAIGADDTYESTVYMKAGTDTYFGNPASTCENVAVVQYDKTYIKKVTGDSPAPVPGAFTYLNSTYDGSNAMIIPKSADGAEVSWNLKIESTSSDPTGGDHPRITVYDCNIDKNEDTLEIIEGVEDEDLNSLSLASQSMYVYYS